jgi:hypothetical protein
MIRRRIATLTAAAAAAGVLLTTPALAATPAGAQPAGQPINACVKPSGVLDYLQFAVTNFGNCAKGDNHWTWAEQGPAGPAGPAGPQGPSGVVSTGQHNIVSGPVSENSGGHFTDPATGAKDVGQVKLAAGTYWISVNAQTEPNATASGQIFPQFFVYDGPQTGSDFSNDLFNIGAGAQEPFIAGNATQHDSYYSGSTQITVPAGGATLHFYAFGYDSDSGASTYNLMTLKFAATQLNPAS